VTDNIQAQKTDIIP